jgi:hypothetical protein
MRRRAAKGAAPAAALAERSGAVVGAIDDRAGALSERAYKGGGS